MEHYLQRTFQIWLISHFKGVLSRLNVLDDKFIIWHCFKRSGSVYLGLCKEMLK